MNVKKAAKGDMVDYARWRTEAHRSLVVTVESLGYMVAESERDFPFDQGYRNGLMAAVRVAVNVVPGWIGMVHGSTMIRATVAQGHATLATEGN